MKLTPSPDSDIVIAAKAARNANELIVVVARVNTHYQQIRKQFSRYDENTPMKEYFQFMSLSLEILRDLRAVYVAATSLADVKRDRCREAVMSVTSSVAAMLKEAKDRVSALSTEAVSDKLKTLSEHVKTRLAKRSDSVEVFNISDGTSCYSILTVKGLELPTGYTSAEVVIKLRESPAGTHVCFPTCIFSESDYYSVSNKTVLTDIVNTALDYDAKVPTASPVKLESQGCVKFVSVSDSLNIYLYDNATAKEINYLLKVSVPVLRKAVGGEALDVLHKMDRDEEGRVLRFLVSGKEVVDVTSMNKLKRILKIGKKCSDSLDSIMGEP